MKNTYYTPKQNGFTLIELIVTVIILAILAAIALPNYQRMIQRQDVSKFANQFKSSLGLARQMADVSSRPVTVCPVTDLSVKPWACADNWNFLNEDGTRSSNAGWIVFHDGEQVIRRRRMLDRKYSEGADSRDKLYKMTPFNSDKTALQWTNESGSVIMLYPRGTTGSAGTLRLYSRQLGDLKPWDRNNPPAMDIHNNEARVSLTSLGQVTLKK